MAVEWSDDYDQEFTAELQVDLQNHQRCALAELTNVISKNRLETFTVFQPKNVMDALYTVTIATTKIAVFHLASIMKKLHV